MTLDDQDRDLRSCERDEPPARTLSSSVLKVAGSGGMTRVLVLVFALQAAWIALSARPIVYDEPYHVAAARAFSTRWTPFFSQEIADGPVGDIERYGSYLYHYVLGLVLRVVGVVGADGDQELLAMRGVSILAATASMVVAWMLLREMGLGPVAANLGLLIVSTVPVTVFLAATVNYDNFLALLVTSFFYLALRLMRADRFDITLWLALIVVTGAASLTKYTFLALGPVVLFGVVLHQWRAIRAHGWGLAGKWFGLERRERVGRMLLVLLAAVVVGLVLERYLGNLFVYGTPVPSCLAVQPEEICEMHGPTARNATLDAQHADVPVSIGGALTYLTYHWLPLMLRYGTLIGVISAEGGALLHLGPNSFGFIVAWTVPIVLALVVAAVLVLRLRRIGWLVAGGVCYLAALFGQNYLDYTRLGEPVGVQGRYVLLLLPLVVGLVLLLTKHVLLTLHRRAQRRLVVVSFTVLLLTLSQGGGVISYLWSSGPSWWRVDGGVVFDATTLGSRVAHLVVLPDSVVRDPRR